MNALGLAIPIAGLCGLYVIVTPQPPGSSSVTLAVVSAVSLVLGSALLGWYGFAGALAGAAACLITMIMERRRS